MHLSIDPDMNIHEIAITDTEVSDSEGMALVMPSDVPIDKVIADGAYYSIERGEAMIAAGITGRTHVVSLISLTDQIGPEGVGCEGGCARFHAGFPNWATCNGTSELVGRAWAAGVTPESLPTQITVT